MTSLPLSLELEPGETVIWTCQPLPARLLRQSVPKGLFGLFFVSFALLWMCAVVAGWNNNWDRGQAVAPFATHNVVIAAGAGLWFLPLGIYMLSWPMRAWRQARTTVYALTDRRALIVKPALFGAFRVLSFPPEGLALIQFQERDDGSGDIVFENRKAWYGMREPSGFMAIARARDVETLLRKFLAAERFSSALRKVSQAPAPRTIPQGFRLLGRL
jgi:hypothetical protein